LTVAKALTDPSRVASYDRLDWHVDSAIAAGQPPERAFTHIGFYLEWLIRHDLHNARVFPAGHIDAVKQGEMTGSDLADDIDTKLISDDMNAEGRAFSDAGYRVYLTEYKGLFSDFPDYGVADEPANYGRVEQLLDRLYAEWVAAGRPKPPPDPAAFDFDIDVPTSSLVMFPPDFSQEQIDDFLKDLPGDVQMMPRSTQEQRPHAAPDLEALIPVDLAKPPMEVSSVRAEKWGSSLLKRALKHLDVQPRDAVVVTAIGGLGEMTLTVTLYGVPGASVERLEVEFRSVIFLLPGSKWEPRTVAGRELQWASGREFTVAYWTLDGLVVHVAGEAATVEAAIPRLPG
jgi:hypothetical protein